MSIQNITFEALSRDHFPLLFDWLNRPHIKKWWMSPSNPEELQKKYLGYLKPNPEATPFMVYKDEIPVGYVQYYTFGSADEVCPPHLGVDIFIGDPLLMGQGLGRQILSLFVQKLFAELPYVKKLVVDPYAHNKQAIKCFQAAGFVINPLYAAPDEPVLLMVLDR